LGNYHNNDKGWDIAFNNRSVRNTSGHNAGESKIALLEHVPDLIENGIYLDTTNKADGIISHIFAAKAIIDGKPSVVGFVVRKVEDGMRYYDHAMRVEEGWTETRRHESDTMAANPPENPNSIKFEEEGRTEPRTRESDTTAANPPENPNSLYNILKKHLGVNTMDKKSPGAAPD
jgi:hypothetical protein